MALLRSKSHEKIKIHRLRLPLLLAVITAAC
jgi:hypothetical protein